MRRSATRIGQCRVPVGSGPGVDLDTRMREHGRSYLLTGSPSTRVRYALVPCEGAGKRGRGKVQRAIGAASGDGADRHSSVNPDTPDVGAAAASAAFYRFGRWSDSDASTVGGEHGAMNEAGGLGSEEDDGLSDLLRLPGASGRPGGSELV